MIDCFSAHYIIVGLGNPGEKYTKNRHNIGFRLIDHIRDVYDCSSFRSKDAGLVSEGKIADQRVWLLKPMNYMNRSGNAVRLLAQYYKVPCENIIVLHDDIELGIEQIKIKQGGGHGGHNGLRDIDAQLGKNYWRLRFGVGHPGRKDLVSDYVLNNFSGAEEKIIQPMVQEIAQEFHYIIEKKIEDFLRRLTFRKTSKSLKE